MPTVHAARFYEAGTNLVACPLSIHGDMHNFPIHFPRPEQQNEEAPSFHDLSLREQTIVLLALCLIYLSAQCGGATIISDFLWSSLDRSAHLITTSRSL